MCETLTKKNARRSLVANKKIYKGDLFTKENLTTKRPGTGISADQYFKFLGTKSKHNYQYDDLIQRYRFVQPKNTGIIVQARISSKRFPKKILKKIYLKYTVIDFLLKRLKKTK